MIKIGKPQVKSDATTATLFVDITIDDICKEVWFRVDKKFEDYLCYERGDAYVIAVLNYAMRNHHDIVSEAPLTEDLYYNIDKYLVDAIAQYNKDFYRPNITADVASEALPCAGAVGTGISCGVDSLHALACQTAMKFKRHNITHLTFNNVGSHGEGEYAEQLYQARLERPRAFAKEYGFEIVASVRRMAFMFSRRSRRQSLLSAQMRSKRSAFMIRISNMRLPPTAWTAIPFSELQEKRR